MKGREASGAILEAGIQGGESPLIFQIEKHRANGRPRRTVNQSLRHLREALDISLAALRDEHLRNREQLAVSASLQSQPSLSKRNPAAPSTALECSVHRLTVAG